MNDRFRHRHEHAPHGSLPNWVLVAVATGAAALVTLASIVG
ncbi:MAG TPA: hypothetical protein VFX50_14635 [Gemmatimonadales bacterium]|nr:hypothetical protein [Gemmatimonadales bacterium]